MKHVDFLIAGVQKAATSTLFELLSRHPDLLAATRKEVHYFDDESETWERPNYERYHTSWGEWTSSRMRFEATPIYTYWPPSLDRIVRYSSDISMIVCFRDPIDRAFSHWRMETQRKAETLSFGEAIRLESERLTSAPPLSPVQRIQSYVARGLYSSQVRRLLSVFPSHRILFLSFDDLTADQPAQVARITDWLGIRTLKNLENAHVRPGQPSEIDQQDVAYLRPILRDDVAEFSQMTGIDVSSWRTIR